MHTSLVLTVVGPDRTGIVGGISRAVVEHGGNWVESRMAKLAGQFAGIVRIEVASPNSQSLKAALSRLEQENLQIRVAIDDQGQVSELAASQGGSRFSLELVGHDREGIIHEVIGAVSEVGLNVLDLTTRVESAPMSGELLFKAIAQLELPVAKASVDVASLQDQLADIADRLGLDLAFEPLADDANS